ncbi:hypothetical protein D6D24_09705 [Aureobasidium pullulans]|uniref:Uncharacterized protein n=1 Tax=Aureobasidium pullulans TaxID=5580 RepID=A0A4S8V7B9_AURPU|nr:hypothetical protein D6D24_09705 [Aureobasidium pullulans]
MKLSTVFGASAVVAGALTGATTTESDSVLARDVDASYREKVVAAPADNRDCNSAEHRDTDTKVQNHCHKFDKPFVSLSVTRKSGHNNAINGQQPCYALVFTDYKCKVNGLKVVDLNDVSQLGVCHNLDDLDRPAGSEGVAGHSWMWVCGQKSIDKHLPKNKKTPKIKDTSAITVNKDISTITVNKDISTTTVVSVATTIMDCSLTTELGFSTTASSNVITKTSIETSVATHHVAHTHVITHIQSLMIPFSSTYSVCDVEVSTLY